MAPQHQKQVDEFLRNWGWSWPPDVKSEFFEMVAEIDMAACARGYEHAWKELDGDSSAYDAEEEQE